MCFIAWHILPRNDIQCVCDFHICMAYRECTGHTVKYDIIGQPTCTADQLVFTYVHYRDMGVTKVHYNYNIILRLVIIYLDVLCIIPWVYIYPDRFRHGLNTTQQCR